MKLRSIRVNQFKMFMEPHCVSRASDGLNLIAGPNEIGKSSMFDALRAVLFETYRSRGKRIEDLRNDRSHGAPLIELIFDHDDGRYVLTKQFLERASAKFECPNGVIFDGPEAEERLRELLQFAQAPSGGASAESMRTWDVLWVKQGDSIANPELSNSARATLSDAVQAAAADVIGGKLGRGLLVTLKKDRDALVSPGSRRNPRAAYRDAIDQVRRLERDLEELGARRDQAEQELEDLNSAEEELRQLDAGNLNLADRVALQRRREDLLHINAYETRLKEAATALENRELRSNEARREQGERSTARSALQQESEQLRSEKEALSSQQAKLDLLNMRILLRLENQLEDAKAKESLADKEHRAAASILATDEVLERIQNANRELSGVATRLGTAATRITFEIGVPQQPDIQVDGRPLPDVLSNEPQPLERVEPLEIAITNMGRILIDPNVADRDELLQARQQADEELRDALEAAGAHSVEDARQKNRQRREHCEQESNARLELVSLAPEGVEELQHEVTKRRSQLTDISAEAWSQANHMAPNNADLNQLKIDASKLQLLMDGLKATVENLEESVGARTEGLRLAELDEPDEQLARNVADADKELSTAKDNLKALNDGRPNQTSEELTTEIEQWENELEQRTNLIEKIAGFRALVDRDEAAGIHEQVESVENELEQAGREVTRLEHEVAVLNLLIETLTEAENDAKNQYLQPVLQKVLPYLQKLFPGAEIAIDNALNVTAITRDASYEESFISLSMGTQEQIAVIVRLALAKLLAEQGIPAVVILDDALIYSDDTRMRIMFDILTEAAKDIQILIFTCREQLFEELDAHRLAITPCDR